MAQRRERACELDEQAKVERSQLRKDAPLGPDGRPLPLVDYDLFDDDSFRKDAYGQFVQPRRAAAPADAADAAVSLRPPDSVPSPDCKLSAPTDQLRVGGVAAAEGSTEGRHGRR